MNKKKSVGLILKKSKAEKNDKKKIIYKGETLRYTVSEKMVGKVFNGFGETNQNEINEKFEDEKIIEVYGEQINPFSRKYSKEIIVTGISSIDIFCPLSVGQRTSIFSSYGLEHHKLISFILKNIAKDFYIVFCMLGVKKK